MNEESLKIQPSLATLEDLLKTGRVIISPEGVEELIKDKLGIFITLTAGGKYRLYVAEKDHFQAMFTVDTLETARKKMMDALSIRCALHMAPEETIKAMLGALKKPD